MVSCEPDDFWGDIGGVGKCEKIGPAGKGKVQISSWV
jgi:hypothetical protein